MARVQRYIFPDHPLPIPLSTALIALPGEIQTRIFLYLSIDDLSVLSQCVDELKGLHMDEYLRKVWYSSTVPARLDFALFSSYNARPDVHELVRRGTIKGVAIVAGVRNGSYWCSESAVRLSNLHHALQQAQLRRQLSSSLSSSRRPTLHTLHSRHIIPSSSSPLTSAMIVARVYTLDKARERDAIKRALTAAKIGQRTLIDVLTETTGRENRWAASEGERVRWAVCPGIRGKMRFFEQLASGAAVSLAGESGVGKRVAAA